MKEICDICINEDLASEFKETLSYAIDEEEILVLPYTMRKNANSISTYAI